MILTQEEAAAAMGDCAVDMLEIIEDVALQTGASAELILGKSRIQKIVRARHLAFWHGKRMGLSLNQIGAPWGFDHTSVLNGIRATQRRIDAATN